MFMVHISETIHHVPEAVICPDYQLGWRAVHATVLELFKRSQSDEAGGIYVHHETVFADVT